MHNMTYQKGLHLWRELLAGSKLISDLEKMLPKGGFLPILSCFPFSYDENMIKY